MAKAGKKDSPNRVPRTLEEQQLLWKILNEKVSRRQAISKGAAIGIGAGFVVVGAAAYFAGSALTTQPTPSTVTSTSTLTSTVPSIQTSTSVATSTTTAVSTSTATSTTTAVSTSTVNIGPTIGGTLKHGTQAASTDLDPMITSTSASYNIMQQTMEGLLALDPVTAQPIAQLATKIPDISADGLTYSVELRPGATWSNGDPLTADDVQFTFERIRDNPNATASLFFPNIDHVDVVDTTHAKIVLKSQWGPMLIALGLIWGKLVHKAPTGTTIDYNKQIIGTGPYTLTERQLGQLEKMVQRRNSYWQQDQFGNTLPYLDELDFMPITDSSVQLLNIQSKQLDTSENISTVDLAKVKSTQGLNNWAGNGSSWVAMEMNLESTMLGGDPSKGETPFTGRPLLLRQAISKAIDRKQLVSIVFQGYAEPVGTTVPPWQLEYRADVPTTPDPTQAQALLKQAGYTNGVTLNWAVLGITEYSNVAKVIQGQLAQVGITLNLIQKDPTTFWDWWFARGDNWDSANMGNNWKVDPGLGIAPYPGWNDGYGKKGNYKPFDDLVKQVYTTTDKSQRVDLIKQLQQMVYVDQAWEIPIYQGYNTAVWWDSVKGFNQPSVLGYWDLPRTWKKTS